jgi:Na+/H+ antiporter NhaD/arsenite permease-like protein
MKRMTGYLFIVINVFMSAIMSCLVGEVTSIVFMLALIFQVCDTLKVSPTPHVFISVIATNIGSSGTMLGNPVGILIGTKAGFTFIDFMITAFPIMLISLAGALAVIIIWYKKEIRLFTERLEARRKMLIGLGL